MFYNAGAERASWPSTNTKFSLCWNISDTEVWILYMKTVVPHIQNIQQIKSTHAIIIFALILFRPGQHADTKERKQIQKAIPCCGKCITMNTQTKDTGVSINHKRLGEIEEARLYSVYLVSTLTLKTKWCHQTPHHT